MTRLTPHSQSVEGSPAPAGAPLDLANVSRCSRGSVVSLPPELSRAAVRELLRRERLPGTVVMGPADIAEVGSIGPEQWAIITPPRYLHFAPDRAPATVGTGDEVASVFVFPKHTLVLPEAQVRWVLSALEAVKPEKLDAEGRPLPWVPVAFRAPVAPLEASRDEDARVDDGPLLPDSSQPEGDEAGAVIASSTIREWFADLCAAARLPVVPLVVRRGGADPHGFVSGSIALSSGFAPRRVTVTTSPNADQAEIVATLAHELAHPLSRSTGHGPAFCQALLELACRLWGEPYLAGARALSEPPYAVLDRWVACGVRAALAGREPPARRRCDDGHAARVVSKVTKLRALASDQLGRPEGIGATATANDLITLYGLDLGQLGAAQAVDDQLTDRFVLLEPRQPWQRTLAHEVAAFNGVYSLSFDSKARMHFFGRYSNVVAAEYLCAISIERIKRECAAHVAQRRRDGSLSGGDLRRASVAFCESAAREFARKLERIAAGEAAGRAPGPGEQETALDEAGRFAARQLELRGARVCAGRDREARYSAEGAEAGRRMQVVRGLDSQGAPPRRLTDRSR